MTWDHLHDEDLLFEFRGSSPDDLTSGRFYTGVVDGFAEFGVFVTLGDDVTGLLHHSKLDRRLESLDWEVGDEVIVQVDGVRENGNIDLAWSIRQSPREFRGHGVDPEDARDDTETERDTEPETTPEPPDPEPEKTTTTAISKELISDLGDLVGERIRIEGRITNIRQTSGPTIFSIADETDVVECAAFESAGERAYPDVNEDDVVRLIGVVERHRGEIQVEVESLEVFDDEESDEIRNRLQSAAQERARPDDTNHLLLDPVVADLTDEFVTTATRLREGILAGERILIRHPATADGTIAGAALEHALFSFHKEEGAGLNGDRILERRPMGSSCYEMGDAMFDRGGSFDDSPPLVVLVGAGSTPEDNAGLKFLDLYDIPAVVIDAFQRNDLDESLVDASVVSESAANAAVIAAHVAGMIDTDARDAISPLPAISYRDNPPERYVSHAATHGLDAEAVRERHEAIALTAHYQRYDDKRELINDLLFDPDAAALAAHVSTQYREKIETATQTAQQNCDRITTGTQSITILDAQAHSHRFDFPSRPVLTAELARAEQNDGQGDIVVVMGEDECYLAGDVDADLRELSSAIAAQVTNSGVLARRNKLTFLTGKRDEVKETLLVELTSSTV